MNQRKKLVEFRVDEKSTDTIVLALPEDVVSERIAASNKIETAAQTVEGAMQQAKPAIKRIIDHLKEIAPDEVEMEFGLTFSAEAGVVITSVATEANFKVTVKWATSEKKSG